MNTIHIDLWTSQHCGYCPAAKRLAEKLVKQFPDVALTVRVVDDDQAGAEEAGLSAVPTWIVTNDKEGYKITGVSSLNQLSEAITDLAA